MKKEIEYTTTTDSTHIKEYGQYFTNYNVAKFMAAWVSTDAKKLLDPAVGNSVFLKYAKVFNPDCFLFGYEIDPHILNFFGNYNRIILFMLWFYDWYIWNFRCHRCQFLKGFWNKSK